ncbi:hypothetical protein DTO027I6_10149 [Penicillium roqueforti]|nr:hypothetical protein DTO027I6_10149 [Penicillium roqueforti]
MEKLKIQMLMTVSEQYDRKTNKVAHIQPARIVLLVTIILILLNKLSLLLLVGLLYSLADKIWGGNETDYHSLQQQADQAFAVEGNGTAAQTAKAQQEATKKLKDKEKVEAKAQLEAAKKLKDKKKVEAKAQQEAAKKLKDKEKVEAKAQLGAAKKLKDKEKVQKKRF